MVHDGEYSISLGVNLKQAATRMKDILEATGKKRILILESPKHIYEREYSEAVVKLYPRSKVIKFDDTYPVKKVENDLRINPDTLVFIPGYTKERSIIRKIHQATSGKAVFVVGPQWVYDYTSISQDFTDLFGLQLWSIADITGIDSEVAKDVQVRWTKMGQPDSGNFQYALYDAIITSLEALDDEEVTTQKNAMDKLNNLGKVKGLSRGEINIKNGAVIKSLHLMKWNVDRFEEYKDVNTKKSS